MFMRAATLKTTLGNSDKNCRIKLPVDPQSCYLDEPSDYWQRWEQHEFSDLLLEGFFLIHKSASEQKVTTLVSSFLW